MYSKLGVWGLPLGKLNQCLNTYFKWRLDPIQPCIDLIAVIRPVQLVQWKRKFGTYPHMYHICTQTSTRACKNRTESDQSRQKLVECS